MTLTLRAAIAATMLSACALTATQASAAPVNLTRMTLGYSYYNRPGATLEQHHEAVAACAVEAAKTVSVDEQFRGAMGGGILPAILDEAFASAFNKATAAAGLENCMVVRGWRVVLVPKEEGKALAALAPEALSAALKDWVGAETPHGEVVRVWGNDAGNSASIRFEIRPDKTKDGLLSLKAVTINTLTFKPPAIKPVVSRTPLDKKWPTMRLKASQLTLAPEGSAVLLVEMRGMSMRNGTGLILSRIGPDGVPPSTVDHAPDLVFTFVGLIGAKKGGNMVAAVIPPGRWRIHGMGPMPVLSFCLGAPAFEIKAGETLYAGSFDLSAADMGPDMSLEPAKAWLAGTAAADTVQAASWTNGVQSLCGENAIYALEITGAPFEPGYEWGSRAAATSATPDPASAPASASAP